MQFLQTSALVNLSYRESSESTNTELQALIATANAAEPQFLVTLNQTAGRGRQGRSWQQVPGNTLATSYFLPLAQWPVDQLAPTWVSLLVGAALARVLGRFLPAVQVKWPNDVLVTGENLPMDELAAARGGAKLVGVLCELVPTGFILGAGINLFGAKSELPDGAASLYSAGAAAAQQAVADPALRADFVDGLLAAYVTELQELLRLAHKSAAELRATIAQAMATLNSEVRVFLPEGAELVGTAVGLGENGELLVQDAASQLHTITAADVVHLRAA